MAFPVIAATNSGTNTDDTTHIVNLPTGIVSGNLLLAFCSFDDFTNGTAGTPAGWVEVTNVIGNSSTTAQRTYIFGRYADGTEGADITVEFTTSEGLAYVTHRITGHNVTSNTDITSRLGIDWATHNTSGSGTTYDPPNLAPTNFGSGDNLWIGGAGWDGASNTHVSYPTDLTDNRLAPVESTVGLSVASVESAAASYDPGTGTFTNSDQWASFTLAVQPVAGGDTALAGTAAGTSTGTGNLTTQISLAGSAAGASTGTSLLTTQIALAGTAGGTSTGASNLTTAIALAGTADGSSTGSGVLSDTGGIALVGAAAGSSTASASLTTQIVLVGAAAGSSTGAAILTTVIALVGTAAGSSTASGMLAADTTLAGLAAGRSGASGFIWPTPLRAEYAIELFSSDGSFGPGTKIAEVWDARNLGWSTYDRIPGKGFFTISQTSPAVSLIDPLLTHVKVWRITAGAAAIVYAGIVVDHDSTGDDIIVSCYEYLSLLAVSRAGFKTLYPSKKIGTEVASPEWTAAKTATSSPLTFVTTGTIEDPLGTDDSTPITTSAAFGTLDQQRLQLMFDLSEIGRANTDHHVTYGITRTAPHTFSFSKDKGTVKDVAFVLNGNVSDYRYIPNWLRYRNDIATIGQDATGAPSEIVKADAGAAAAKGLRQDVFPIQTLLGISGAATEADQQQAVTARALNKALQLQPAIQLTMLAGAHDPFSGYEVCDKVTVELGNGKEAFSQSWRVIGLTCIVTEPGERLGVIVSPVLT